MSFIITAIEEKGDLTRVASVTGESAELPTFCGRFLRHGDALTRVGDNCGSVLIERRLNSRTQVLLIARVRSVAEPKEDRNGDRWLLRAQLLDSGLNVFVEGDAVRAYFYGLDAAKRSSLYECLGAAERASIGDLRLAWRLQKVELTAGGDHRVLARAERAFNILADPRLRNCYDAMRCDDEAPPLFPYGGCGWIALEGNSPPASDAFFAKRILAFKPETFERKLALLLHRNPARTRIRIPKRKRSLRTRRRFDLR